MTDGVSPDSGLQDHLRPRCASHRQHWNGGSCKIKVALLLRLPLLHLEANLHVLQPLSLSSQCGMLDMGELVFCVAVPLTTSHSHQPQLLIYTLKSRPRIPSRTGYAQGTFARWNLFDVEGVEWDSALRTVSLLL